MDEPELHPLLAPLAGFVGCWRGIGHGEYPTIADFDYVEELAFDHDGRPFLGYEQRSRAAADGRALHGERGYVKVTPEGRVEATIAQTTSIAEVAEGRVEPGRLDLAARLVRATGAKEVTGVWRHLEVLGDTLTSRLDMAAVGEPRRLHLRSTLRRTS